MGKKQKQKILPETNADEKVGGHSPFHADFNFVHP